MWMKYAIATESMMTPSSEQEAGGGEERGAEAAVLDADLDLGLRQRDLVLDQRARRRG